jgi:hypothetical protein
MNPQVLNENKAVLFGALPFFLPSRHTIKDVTSGIISAVQSP